MRKPPKLTADLLRRACVAAERHGKMIALISEAMRDRYGVTHSDVDCDVLIDVLDYMGGEPPTLRECDELMHDAMRRAGVPIPGEAP